MVREEVGYFTPAQAREIWRWIKWLQKSKGQLIAAMGNSGGMAYPEVGFDGRPILAKNVASETIPRFACVQATGVTMENDQCYLNIEKPVDSTGDAGPFFFNLFDDVVHTPADGKFPFTVVTAGPHANAIASNAGSWAAGTRLSPQASSFELDENPAGAFALIGNNDGPKLGDDVIRVRVMAEQRRLMMFIAPSGGVPAASGSTAGTASCTPYKSASGSRSVLNDADGAGQTLSVLNYFRSSIAEGDLFMAYWEWGAWVVINADC